MSEIDLRKPFFAVMAHGGAIIDSETREGFALAKARGHAEKIGGELFVIECVPKHRVYQQPSVACEEFGKKPRKPRQRRSMMPDLGGSREVRSDVGIPASVDDELPDFLRRNPTQTEGAR